MKKAFSLIEVVISIGVIMLFTGLVLPRYNDYNNQLKLKKEVRRLVSVIELAKKKALSSDLYNRSCTSFEGYRVEIGATTYGLNFLCSGTFAEIGHYVLDNNLTITAGTGDMDFPPIGATINIPMGTVTIKNNSIDKCIDISITSIGIVTSNETLYGC